MVEQEHSSTGFLCTEKEATLSYLTSVANNPEKISQLIDYIEYNDYEIDNKMDRDDSDLPLLSFIGHLRDPKSIEVNPFSQEAKMGRLISSGVNFDPECMQIVVPEEGDTHFIKFIFNNQQEEELIMDNVQKLGFSDFVSSECLEDIQKSVEKIEELINQIKENKITNEAFIDYILKNALTYNVAINGEFEGHFIKSKEGKRIFIVELDKGRISIDETKRIDHFCSYNIKDFELEEFLDENNPYLFQFPKGYWQLS